MTSIRSTPETISENTPPSTVRRAGADPVIALATTGSAVLVLLLWRLAGVEPLVRAGDGTRAVGAVSVLVTAALVSVAGLGLLRLLERRVGQALRVWTLVAGVVWLVSFLGPLGAADVGSGLALASLHLVVGAALVLGVRVGRRRA